MALPGTGHPLSLYLGNLADIATMGLANERLMLDTDAPTAEPVNPVSLAGIYRAIEKEIDGVIFDRYTNNTAPLLMFVVFRGANLDT